MNPGGGFTAGVAAGIVNPGGSFTAAKTKGAANSGGDLTACDIVGGFTEVVSTYTGKHEEGLKLPQVQGHLGVA